VKIAAVRKRSSMGVARRPREHPDARGDEDARKVRLRSEPMRAVAVESDSASRELGHHHRRHHRAGLDQVVVEPITKAIDTPVMIAAPFEER
jgi:hypothetical protein